MNKDLIKEATELLNVGLITIKEGFFKTENEFSSIPEEQHILQGYSSTINCEEFDSPEGGFAYIFTYAVAIRAIPEEDSDTAIMEIKAKFEVAYTSSIKVSPDAIVEFGNYNVGYHVWPYWREFVQSSCSRLGISPIEVPFYKVSEDS
ncbi:hypothetical protein ACMXYW_14960 [Neptuniibacter sp. QD48_55]|uniref:hypothetical protein n=1 Tax=Neptuniibacter sp. QD48_55 TaxID=3398212 RepID=UPI0039F623EE